MDLSADEIKARLGLRPHNTCGYVVETWRSSHEVPRQDLPPAYDGARPLGSTIYFLVAPDRRMVLHRVRADQFYHHYRGDPIEVLLLYPNGSAAVATVGADIGRDMRPQLFIPGGTYHVSRLVAEGRWALLGATAWPAVEPPDAEPGDVQRLCAAYPAFAERIRDFTA